MRARAFYGEACQLPLAAAFYALVRKISTTRHTTRARRGQQISPAKLS
jgi:hypothetical protein